MAWNLSNHFTTSLVTSAVVLLALYWYAYRSHWAVLDLSGERSLHQGKALTGAGLWLFVPLCAVTIYWFPHWLPSYYLLTLCMLGFIDDKHDLAFQLRLVIQSVVAVLTLYYFQFHTHLPLSLFLLIGLLWWVNLFNFMDGINGMVAFHGMVTLVFYGLWFGANEEISFLTQTSVLLLLVYVLFNVVLKKLFMGDSGSLPLAWLLAIMALTGLYTGQLNMLQIAAIHAVLITDSTLTILLRWHRGQQITQAHSTHLYQRLVKSGYSHAMIAAVYALVTLIICLMVWFTRSESMLIHAVLCLVMYTVLTGLFISTLKMEQPECQ